MAGPAEPHPADLRGSHLTGLAGQAADVPVVAALSDDPNPLMDTCLTLGGPPMRPGEETAHGLGEIPQRLLPHRLRTRRQPPEHLPGVGQLTGLLEIARRARPARPPMLMLLHR